MRKGNGESAVKRVLVGSTILVLATLSIAATAPEQINYQAKVETRGVPFDGVGQFKFAIVDEAGTNTYWSNDGTSVAGNAPSNPVSLNVKGGLLNVILGNESYPNMQGIPATVFSHPDAWFRVWFGGETGIAFERLVPDTKMASVPYAMMAETVADNSITGEKLCVESVWPQHEGRNDCIVSYYAEWTGLTATSVVVAVIASNKNYIITDIVMCNLEDVPPAFNNADVDIRYTKGGLDTILYRRQTVDISVGGTAPMPAVSFRGGLVVPGGAELKIGPFRSWGHTRACTVSGFEVPIE